MDTQVAPSLEGSEGETGNWPCDASFRLPASILYSLTAAEVTSAVASGFGDASLLGFDIEWRPNFSPGEDNDTAVVQLATDDACLVAHVAHMKVGTLAFTPLSTFHACGNEQSAVARFFADTHQRSAVVHWNNSKLA
jgi:hypothetical protein